MVSGDGRRGLPGLRALWGGEVADTPPDDDAEALVRSDGSALTYAQLAAAIGLSTNHLREAGVGPGSVVAVAVAEPAGFLIAALGAWECGAAVLPLEARDTQPGAQARLDALAERGHASIIVTEASIDGELVLRTAPGAARIDPRCGLVLFTSGSSGPPKGVLLARAGLAANVDAILKYLPLRTFRRTAIVLPLTYSYALVGQALASLRAGATLLLLGEQRYPSLQLDTMAWLEAQGLSSVPTQLKLLARARLEKPDSPAPPLAYLASAGARLDAATIALLREAFPKARLFSQYGLTEASPRVAAIGDAHPAFARGAAGLPLEGVEVWAEDESGARLPANQRGALFVRSPSVMLGYLDDEAATARVLSKDGALRTGDVGFLDEDGALFVEGRADGVVKVAGERVGLEGIAEALRGAPGVRDAAVIALPDETLGSRLFGFIEGEGSLPAARAVVRSLRPAQRPSLMLMAALPRTERQKIDLAALKTMASQLAQVAGRARAAQADPGDPP